MVIGIYGPAFYDSSRPCSVVCIHGSEKEHLDEVTQEEQELHIIWDEEISVTSSGDVEEITYEDLVERNMIIPSPYEYNDKECLNPFSTIIEDGTTPYFTDSCYM